jgi:hypothetical protein
MRRLEMASTPAHDEFESVAVSILDRRGRDERSGWPVTAGGRSRTKLRFSYRSYRSYPTEVARLMSPREVARIGAEVRRVDELQW